ncbi:peptidase M10A and M12B matrixin and adamalysin [Candidatus Nitrosopumilus koreensis AR1]|uniref:Peptidase M10A and M12B matrixin and adamalysin n=1 Tax=Candidatus Nitrosopumilus koreensis AR1 TaxID=1229908 RepID=K0B2P5_9ARCH|nr:MULTISPECIES: matrixin family metalloprotease [Nitrosopumilus]AFS80308.1 peptidase M10A and M12B matrixin and adamalysin [Candidatus Nitrosopumilus koreensis AR1]
MKRAIVAVLSTVLLLSLIPNYNSFADKPDNVGNPEPISIEKLLEPKSIKMADGRVLEKRVHIFPNDNAAKPDGKGGPPDGKGGGNKGSACYSEISKGAKWKSSIGESYIIDDSNSGLASGVALAGIESSISSWESEITSGTSVFGSGSEGILDPVAIANAQTPSGTNEIVFAPLSSSGTIAVTITWGYFSGPPGAREIVEWDQIYNTYWNWGNAGPTNENELGDTNVMDFENIAVHEVGHATGLDHSGDCVEETMYAYAQNGETKKRTLNTGDIAGINSLY